MSRAATQELVVQCRPPLRIKTLLAWSLCRLWGRMFTWLCQTMCTCRESRAAKDSLRKEKCSIRQGYDECMWAVLTDSHWSYSSLEKEGRERAQNTQRPRLTYNLLSGLALSSTVTEGTNKPHLEAGSLPGHLGCLGNSAGPPIGIADWVFNFLKWLLLNLVFST